MILQTLPPLPPSFPDIPNATEESDIVSLLVEEKSHSKPSAKPVWLADAMNLFVLLCSFLLIIMQSALKGSDVLLRLDGQYSQRDQCPSRLSGLE